MKAIWGALEMKETGEGSTGCGRDLRDERALGRDGILWTLFSLSGSDSVPLKEVSRSAGATGQVGIKDYSLQSIERALRSEKD